MQAPDLSQFGADELDDDTETGDAFENGRIFDDHLQEGQRLKKMINNIMLKTENLFSCDFYTEGLFPIFELRGVCCMLAY